MLKPLALAALIAAPAAALWPSAAPTVVPKMPAWLPITYDFECPSHMTPDGSSFSDVWAPDGEDVALELNNPWLHVRLTVRAIPPFATLLPDFIFPGYYIGDSDASGDEGNYWRAHFTPPEHTGEWELEFYFEHGDEINVAAVPDLVYLDNLTPQRTETFSTRSRVQIALLDAVTAE